MSSKNFSYENKEFFEEFFMFLTYILDFEIAIIHTSACKQSTINWSPLSNFLSTWLFWILWPLELSGLFLLWYWSDVVDSFYDVLQTGFEQFVSHRRKILNYHIPWYTYFWNQKVKVKIVTFSVKSFPTCTWSLKFVAPVT